jgi:hypothetical protein
MGRARRLVGPLQAFLFILLIEDHARLKAIFKYEIMRPDFKLADTSLMREVELLQQSAAFLFGAGVVAGFTAGTPRGITTPQQQPQPQQAVETTDKQQQDSAQRFLPAMWALWGVIAAFLLFAVLSAFFARMMASMLWSLARDYLDRLAPIYDHWRQICPDNASLADVKAAWEEAKTAAKEDKNRRKAGLGMDISNHIEGNAAGAEAVPATQGQPLPGSTTPATDGDGGCPTEQLPAAASGGSAQGAAASSSSSSSSTTTTAQLPVSSTVGDSHGTEQLPAAASGSNALGAAASSSTAQPPVSSAVSTGNSKTLTEKEKTQEKQLIYWNALGPALAPGINTVRAFISLAKIFFLAAVVLWLVVFMFIATTKAADMQSLYAVLIVTMSAVAVTCLIVHRMVKYVFAVFCGYHKPNGTFWPDKWGTKFTLAVESAAGAAAETQQVEVLQDARTAGAAGCWGKLCRRLTVNSLAGIMVSRRHGQRTVTGTVAHPDVEDIVIGGAAQ